MTGFPRILEITLYALINFLPFLGMGIYTFYERPRFGKKITCLICISSIIVQIITRFMVSVSSDGNSLNIILVRLLIYVILMFIAIDAHPGKLLFTELVFTNLSTLIMITASCMDSLIFSSQEHILYCWHKSVIIFLLHFMVTLPFYFVVKKLLRPVINQHVISPEWQYYWLVPAAFCLIWMYQLYGNSDSLKSSVTNPNNVIFLIIVNAAGHLVYYLILRLSHQLWKNLELEQQAHYSDIEKLEYQLLTKRITEVRRTRHDLRHHMILLEKYLKEKDYERLHQYFAQYSKSVDTDPSIHFCDHRSINTLLLHFAQQAKENEIDFQIHVRLFKDIPVPDIDISVILGNLLENALDACKEQNEGDKIIRVNGRSDEYTLAFTIDNTFTNEIRQNRDGQFLSTKQKGLGLGIESVKHIVERHNGIFTAEKKGDMFYTSFLINLK